MLMYINWLIYIENLDYPANKKLLHCERILSARESGEGGEVFPAGHRWRVCLGSTHALVCARGTWHSASHPPSPVRITSISLS